MRLFVCGDVMTGRGIDQIMPHPCTPDLFEPYMHSALGYVTLAERRSGAIPRAVDFDYIWGAALPALDRRRPDLRLVNLETSITARGRAEPKGINYRMSPDNIACLAAARIDCCVLANNHVGDWGEEGLSDTLDALAKAGIRTVGAGRDQAAAARPAVLAAGDGHRLLVLAFGTPSSGIPPGWAAGPSRPGVNILEAIGEAAVRQVAAAVEAWRKPGDLVLLSIHWGPNWGYEIGPEERAFAHRLIDEAKVDIVHGHSSHHPRAIEVYKDKPIFYGCGDLINDYEGIGGEEVYRPELVLGYVLDVDEQRGVLQALELMPFRISRFSLMTTTGEERTWLARRLDRECRRFGHRVVTNDDATLSLAW